MMKRIALAAAAYLCGCAGPRWQAGDYVLSAGYVGAEVVDFHQTAYATSHCVEQNPIMGQCGDAVPREVYFPAVVVANILIANALPGKWRTAFQAVTLGFQLAVDYHNLRYGAGGL